MAAAWSGVPGPQAGGQRDPHRSGSGSNRGISWGYWTNDRYIIDNESDWLTIGKRCPSKYRTGESRVDPVMLDWN